MKQNTANFG